MNPQTIARVFGVLFLITFITSIPADRLEKSVGYAYTTRGGRLRACNLLEDLFPVGKQHAL
jgi:hypothetical protein